MAKFHNFDEPINRIGTDSFKWDYEGEDGKYIPLGVADTDFKVPQEAIDAVRSRVDFGVYAYGDIEHVRPRVNSAICGWYQRRFGIEVNPADICFAQGLMTGALWMSVNAFTRPGDQILIMSPVYHTFSIVIRGMGRFPVSSDLILKDGYYTIDYEDLDKKLQSSKVRALLICNPHNPVGRVWTEEELTKVAAICKKNDKLIISDEIHGDIAYGDHKVTSMLKIPDAVDRLVVMNSPSKTFNLAALYCAFTIIPNKTLRDQYKVVFDDYHTDYNYLGIEALIACYNECDYYVDQQNEYFWKNICLVKDFIAKEMPEVKVIEPEGTYLMWIDFSAWGMEQDDLMKLFMDNGVKLNSGTNYGPAGKGFIRLNVATQTAVLEKGLECMKKAAQNRPQ